MKLQSLKLYFYLYIIKEWKPGYLWILSDFRLHGAPADTHGSVYWKLLCQTCSWCSRWYYIYPLFCQLLFRCCELTNSQLRDRRFQNNLKLFCVWSYHYGTRYIVTTLFVVLFLYLQCFIGLGTAYFLCFSERRSLMKKYISTRYHGPCMAHVLTSDKIHFRPFEFPGGPLIGKI